jgi:Peptidase family M23/Csd3 second domain
MRTPLIILCMTFFLFACRKSNKVAENTSKTETIENIVEPIDTFTNVYGIKLNKSVLKIDTSKIPKNVLFIDLFRNFNQPTNHINGVISKTEKIFSFKKMRSGVRYNMIYHNSDSGKVADYFIYHDQINRKLIIPLTDSVKSYWYTMSVDTLERTIYAQIDRTLYHSILDADVNYELGLKLADVFAWQVDFFKIDANDFFKVIFNEHQVEGEYYEIGSIKAAEFYHRGDTFFAFNYRQDSLHNYFDQKGRSLRKAFLKAPLKYSRISSRYSKRRFHPVQRRWKAHLGTDYAAPRGTPIRSVGDGKVIASGYSRGNGNYVKVKHNSTYTTQYLHMSRIAKISRVGRHVHQGDVIGYVGSTGLATGPHLCFRFWRNGSQVNPFSIKMPPSKPIKETYRVDFEKYRNVYLTELAALELTPTTRNE